LFLALVLSFVLFQWNDNEARKEQRERKQTSTKPFPDVTVGKGHKEESEMKSCFRFSSLYFISFVSSLCLFSLFPHSPIPGKRVIECNQELGVRNNWENHHQASTVTTLSKTKYHKV